MGKVTNLAPQYHSFPTLLVELFVNYFRITNSKGNNAFSVDDKHSIHFLVDV